MKNRRFFSLFFVLLLLCSLLCPAALAAEGDEDAREPIPDIAVEAKAALLIDPTTDEILYELNIHEQLYPASLTKIMTALLTLEAVKAGDLAMDQVLTASAAAVDLPYDASTAGIDEGEQFTVEQLLYCILVVSAADACNVLAEAVSGSIDAFVERMNQRAAQLGCEDTQFANPHGYHDDRHYSTAWDLYLITRAAREYETFNIIVATGRYEVPATNLNDKRVYYTTNYLLNAYRNADYVYSAANGIKTGNTSNAGYCLVASAAKNGRSLLSVVLGCERVELETGGYRVMSFYETIRLFDWGFDNFTRRTILETAEPVAELEVALSSTDHIAVQPAYEVERLLPNHLTAEDLRRQTSFPSKVVEAPIAKGDVLGEITLSYGDTVYATVPLLAANDVEASRLLVFRRDALEFLSRKSVRIGAIAAVVVILLVVLWLRSPLRRNRRYGKVTHGSANRRYRGRRR